MAGLAQMSGRQVLAVETFPLDDVAMVLAPASGAVAVVDARGRAIVEGLRDGRGEDEIARAQAPASGTELAAAAAQVAVMRQAWMELARPIKPRATRSRRPISASTPALDVICRAGEVPVRLRVWPTRLAGLLRAVTLPSHAAAADDPLYASSVEVHRQGRAYLLYVDGEHLLATNDLMVARSETLRHLVLASRPQREWLAVLHGAGVAGPAGAALLCGFSGAGKSTLTGYLVASGLELVTDDYAPIEAGTRLLWPVPFGLSVKEGSWPLLAPHFPALADAPLIRSRARRQRYLANLRRATRPQPVRCLVFPLYQPGAPLELTALRPGEALELSARSGGWYENSRARLAEFVDWIGATPAYALSYGDTPSAVSTVRRLLGA